jgi:hypothetical protein
MTSFLPERIPYVIVTDQYFNTMKTIEVLLSDNRRFVMKCQASKFGPLFEPVMHSQLVSMSSSVYLKFGMTKSFLQFLIKILLRN